MCAGVIFQAGIWFRLGGLAKVVERHEGKFPDIMTRLREAEKDIACLKPLLNK